MDNHGAFLSLVRLGIGKEVSSLPEAFDWSAIQDLAIKQGLYAVVLDGVERLRQMKPDVIGKDFQDKIMLAQWIGEVHQNYELRYESYKQAIGEMAAFYNEHGFKMMVLKGYACSLDWPRPEHRPCGDIDIWQFGQYIAADSTLEREKGVKIDRGHHHHTVFYRGDFMVENHYDFVNIYAEKSSRSIEKIFKELGEDDSHFVEISENKIYLPSPNLHTLFLLRHMVSHFTSTKLNMRQMLDWAFFVEKHTTEINWQWLIPVINKYHMMDFFSCLNSICVEYLGFNASVFPSFQYNATLTNRILNDTLSPEFNEKNPTSFLSRVVFKYQRWRSNAWKKNLCYEESMWSLFLSGVWNHLLKPSSI